jgi:hypothetical protein
VTGAGGLVPEYVIVISRKEEIKLVSDDEHL